MRKIVAYMVKVTLPLAALLYGCVNDYELPKEISQSYRSEVVIEGRILSGEESVFYVTRTTPLLSGEAKEDIVTNAQVRIIGENGYKSDLAENTEDAKYVINTGTLPANTNYAVEVKVEKDVYQSMFQPIRISTEAI